MPDDFRRHPRRIEIRAGIGGHRHLPLPVVARNRVGHALEMRGRDFAQGNLAPVAGADFDGIQRLDARPLAHW